MTQLSFKVIQGHRIMAQIVSQYANFILVANALHKLDTAMSMSLCHSDVDIAVSSLCNAWC